MRLTLTDLPPGKQLALLIQDVGRLLRSRMDQFAQATGLTIAQWRVLAVVARCQAAGAPPLNQAELAGLLDIEPITLSRQIDRLAATGLIERQPDPNDRRAHRLRLTEKARPMVAEFREAGSRMLADVVLDGISDREVETVIALLERMRQNLTGKESDALPFAETTPAKESA